VQELMKKKNNILMTFYGLSMLFPKRQIISKRFVFSYIKNPSCRPIYLKLKNVGRQLKLFLKKSILFIKDALQIK
jgi:hypothetical protein